MNSDKFKTQEWSNFMVRRDILNQLFDNMNFAQDSVNKDHIYEEWNKLVNEEWNKLVNEVNEYLGYTFYL